MSDSKGLQNSVVVQEMTTNVNVDMNDVVNVFVSKYEDELHNRKGELQKSLSGAKKTLADFIAEIQKTLENDADDFAFSIDELGLVGKVGEVKLVWSSDDQQYRDDQHKNCPKTFPYCKVEINVKSTIDHDSLTQKRFIEIDESDLDTRAEYKENIVEIQTELKTILEKIKDVSRKERQIRGKLAEAKLAEVGSEELLNNPEMLQLIQL